MSHATEIAESTDEMIRVMGTRESGIVDYMIGNRVSVSWRGGDSYLCGTCQGIDRYRNAEKRGCEHCQRVAKYREAHV